MEPEINRVLANPDNVIMSEELGALFPPAEEFDQFLVISDEHFVCRLKSARLTYPFTKTWEFEFEVPGLDFVDIIEAPNIVFSYKETAFTKPKKLLYTSEEGCTFLKLELSEIVIDDEEDSHE
jgi:hypothetical protein